MKAKLLLFSVLLIQIYLIIHATSCSFKDEGFIIKKDTIPINIKGVPLHFLKYKSLNYSFFATGRFIDGIPEEHFYVFTDRGNIISHSNDTGVLNYTFYKDLHVNNDSIIVKTGESDEPSFYWDQEKERWLPAKNVDDVVYEDDDFYITSLDFGEWGASTWFKDKDTDLEYQIGISNPEIYKLHGVYYIVNNEIIATVKNPRELNQIDTVHYYKNNKSGNIHTFTDNEERYSLQGAKILYQRVVPYEIPDKKFYIAKTFVLNNKLFHVIENNSRVYIAALSDGELKPVKDIDKGISLIKNDDSFRNSYLNEAIPFYKKDADTTFGYILIKDNIIKLNYFKQP